MNKKRCPWAENEFFHHYHDEQWGVPIHDDRLLFEFLVLEGAQAGLSWSTILKRRDGYRKAFSNFEPEQVVNFSQDQIEQLYENSEIIRNKRKINATITAAKLVLEIQKEFGSFDNYLWSFVKGKPIINHWEEMSDVPVTSVEAQRLSDDLKKKGFSFVGPVIMYAFMQAVGMVNDHLISCFRYEELVKSTRGES